ncbi:MAG: 2-isopropylmalate synthase [Clostridia bacterium]|jgi:2-isopropylmalate synthase|nr:2-isopropylmalate synthase [Clostridiaceae bacterium]
MKRILIFDTTLRDGEQVPGAKLDLPRKIKIAKQLEALNVDYIEAGFPASSKGDFDAVKNVALAIGENGPVVTALARANKNDIDAVYNSVKYAKKPMIHMVLGTSDIHVEKKFAKSKEEILNLGVEAVKYAKTLLPDVQYSTEDASRSDFEYLWQTVEAVVKAGATIVNIPDTVGYAVPEEFGEMIRKIHDRLMNLNDKVILSVHCHNDTGLAVANTLAAIKNGATKVECTVNGIGERAGNAALEEVVMGIKVRQNYYDAYTCVNTREIKKTSRLVSNLMGLDVQVNKAITGDNAFAHSSGIHQDGLLKSRDVYEIIRPEDVGVEDMELVLTARSGRHAVRNALEKMGFDSISDETFARIHEKFLELADKKKEVYYHDLYYLMEKDFIQEFHLLQENGKTVDLYEFVDFQVISNNIYPSATVTLKKGKDTFTESTVGDGPIDAMYTALKKIVGMDLLLTEYKINSISQGKEALGRASIRVQHEGKSYTARAVDTDIIKASAVAYINVINKILLEQAQLSNGNGHNGH